MSQARSTINAAERIILEKIMTALMARTGRHRQRYSEDKFRLVAGCIPYKLKENVDNPSGNVENKLEVLMISSPNRHDLVFPKGGWEDDETAEEAARREALEEAGVRGVLDENQVGVWEFRSKSRQDSCSTEGSCRGYMFALKVTEELAIWPEQSNRRRIWLSVREAFKCCRYEWMQRALDEFLSSFSEGRKNWILEDTVKNAAVSASISEVTEHSISLPSSYVNSSTPNPSASPINAFC